MYLKIGPKNLSTNPLKICKNLSKNLTKNSIKNLTVKYVKKSPKIFLRLPISDSQITPKG